MKDYISSFERTDFKRKIHYQIKREAFLWFSSLIFICSYLVIEIHSLGAANV